MINLELLENFELYDEKIFLFFEESTLGIRLKKMGYKSKLLLETSYIHEHSVSINKNLKSEWKKRKLMLKSMQRLIYDEYNINSFKKVLLVIWKNLSLIENYILLKFFSKYIRK